MNQDTGQLHAISESLKNALGEKKSDVVLGRVNPRPEETIDQILERARVAQAARVPDSEPLPGAPVPDGWPRFNVGDLVGPVKGWWMEVVAINVEAQTLSIRPKRRAGKRRR